MADGRSPRDGKFIEEIGTYQPRKKSDNVKLDLDRAKYWLSKGAQPSDTVASFIKKARNGSTNGTSEVHAAADPTDADLPPSGKRKRKFWFWTR